MHAADLKVVSIASCQQRMATNNRIHLIKVAAPSGCFPNQTCKISGMNKNRGEKVLFVLKDEKYLYELVENDDFKQTLSQFIKKYMK